MSVDYIPEVTNKKILRGHGIKQSEQKLPKRCNAMKKRTKVLPESENTEINNILVKKRYYLHIPHGGGSSTFWNVIPCSLLQTSKTGSEKKSGCETKAITTVWGPANNKQDTQSGAKPKQQLPEQPSFEEILFSTQKYLQRISFWVPPGPLIKPRFLFHFYPGKQLQVWKQNPVISTLLDNTNCACIFSATVRVGATTVTFRHMLHYRLWACIASINYSYFK